jgi:hypothetical protein
MPKKGYKQTAEHRAAISAATKGPRPHVQKDSASYYAVHIRHQKHWPKTGVCEMCGSKPTTRTDWAYLLHHGDPGGWSDYREDYAEACVPCHRIFDLRS